MKDRNIPRRVQGPGVNAREQVGWPNWLFSRFATSEMFQRLLAPVKRPLPKP